MLENRWPDEAGRAAYLTGPHAARAFIFESTGEITKSHRRAQAEFGRLTKDDPRFDADLRAFLGRAYNLKTLADYETGPGSHVSAERAREAIEAARRFLDRTEAVIPTARSANPSTEPEPKP